MDILDLFSRRNVLLGLGGSAAAGTVAAGSKGPEFFAQLLRPTNGGHQRVPLRSASYDDWAVHVGTNFTAHSGHVLKLIDVQSFPTKGARPSHLRDRAFVARFDIARGGALPEDLYRVAHPGGASFEIFLTKGGADKPQRMLAVFN